MWIVVLIAVVAWGLTDVRRCARIDPENATAHKTDFTVYTEAGAAFFDGRDPYEVTNPRGWHYLYPPLFAILVAPLAVLDSQTQAVVWYFVSVAACFGMWYECRRLWRWLVKEAFAIRPRTDRPSPCPLPEGEGFLSGPPVWLGWLAAATIALPVMNCLQRGQVGVVLTYLLLLGLRLAMTSVSMRGVFLGGIALALAVTIKLTPILPAGVLALALLARAWRSHRGYGDAIVEGLSRGPMHRAATTIAGGLAGLVLFVLVIPGGIVSHAANIGHLQTWGRAWRQTKRSDPTTTSTCGANAIRAWPMLCGGWETGCRLHPCAGPDDRLVDDLAQQTVQMPMEHVVVDVGLNFAKVGLVGLLLIAGWRVAGRGDVSGLVAIFGLACAATLAVSPISWGHHYTVWLPALGFCAVLDVEQ